MKDRLLSAIENIMGDLLGAEGITPELLELVDLEVAHSPVIPFRGSDLMSAVDVTARTRGGKYVVDHPMITHPVDEETIRVMRARYLLAFKAQAPRPPWVQDHPDSGGGDS